MTEHQLDDAKTRNDKSLRTLARALTLSEGQFTLILALCNYRSLQHDLTLQLKERHHVKAREVSINPATTSFETTVQEEFATEPLSALITFGLETVQDLDALLVSLNQSRNELSRNFGFPLVLWVTDAVLQKLIRVAPDFYSWAAVPIEFQVSREELFCSIEQTADKVFETVLSVGAGIFLDTNTLTSGAESSLPAELEFTRYELQNRGIELEPQLEASLDFLLARDADSPMEQARRHYERSLEVWQQSQNLERQGCVLYSLGLWWRTYAAEHRAESEESRIRSKVYFQQCIESFEQAGRKDLCAKFINALGVTLQSLHQWDELEIVVKKALALHQVYSEPFRLARAYGLLAELALSKSDWNEAKRAAQQAIAILDETALTDSASFLPEQNNLLKVSDYHQGWHRSWYLFSLARALSSLDQKQAAIEALETALTASKPYYDPELYIQILEILHSLYFEQGNYLIAFENKQRKRSIEQQYGFCAFIGADRLSPRRRIANPTSSLGRSPKEIPQELIISGRQEDIEHLVERTSRSDHKLTIIYGQSGVGKSSLLHAGLILALRQIKISTRNFLSLPIQVYGSWVQAVGHVLAEALREAKDIEVETPLESIPAILEQLRKNAEYNLVTVLIFDQFEEFFFTCREFRQRLEFYDFLQKCLDIHFVKVVLSLREDYIHYLLECNRLVNMEMINKNILDKKILYYLGNFLRKQAKVVIESLTEQTRLYLEQSLIEQLVNDLVTEAGEVRPIELQIVGAQIQAEKITTLEQYQRSGSKETLVERYLEEVIKDCGLENQTIAQLVLYLLTDENNTRPLKTRPELEVELRELTTELESKIGQLDLVLKIFIRSGLVVLLPEIPTNRYQLIHDYLVSFIREKQGAELVEKLKKSEEQRKLSEAALNRVLKRRLQEAFIGIAVMASLAVIAVIAALWANEQRKQAQISEVKAISASSESLFASNKEFDSLIEAIRAKRKLQQLAGVDLAIQNLQNQILKELQQSVYQVVEYNRLMPNQSDFVWDVAISPDGQIIASASNDKIVYLWNRDGSRLRTLSGHKGSVWRVRFSSDNQMIVSASADKTVRLWSRDGKELHILRGHKDVVWGVAISPDNQIIASASNDKTVRLWSRDGKLLHTLKHKTPVWGVAFSPDGQLIVSASEDGTIKEWSRDGREILTFQGHHDGRVAGVAFSPDGQLIATASQDKTVKLWSRDGKERNTLKGHDDEVWGVAFSSDGQLIATASWDNTIKLWNRNGKLITTVVGHTARLRGIAFSPDGTIASSSEDKTVRLWRIHNTLLTILHGHDKPVIGVSFSPNSQLVASASDDKTVRVWTKNGTLFNVLQHKAQVSGVKISPNGQMLASTDDLGYIYIWSIDGKLRHTFPGHNSKAWDVSFRPDNRLIASASSDNTVKLWTLDGKWLNSFPRHTAEIREVAFSPDSQLIASASLDNTVRLWKLDGTLLHILKHENHVLGLAFSPDSQTIASASSDSTVKLWNVDGSLQKSIPIDCGVRGVSFSPDGQTIASANEDGSVKLWNRDGKLLNTLRGHRSPVWKVMFSPDGQRIASTSEDKTVILWNTERVETLDPLKFGCNWVQDYLRTNPHVSESDRHLCDQVTDP